MKADGTLQRTADASATGENVALLGGASHSSRAMVRLICYEISLGTDNLFAL